jgi:hypothetical protein
MRWFHRCDGEEIEPISFDEDYGPNGIVFDGDDIRKKAKGRMR